MDFISNFGKNLIILVVIGLALLLMFPDLMQGVFKLYGALFGPGLVILLIVAAALPRRKR